MKFNDLSYFFSSVSLNKKKLLKKEKNSVVTIALICIDVPYSLVKLLIAPFIPENVKLLKYTKDIEIDAALVIYFNDINYSLINSMLDKKTDFIIFATENELLSDSPVISHIKNLITESNQPATDTSVNAS